MRKRVFIRMQVCLGFRQPSVAMEEETDWDFLCRLMEENGLFYFFEHDHESHKLIVANSAAAHADILPEKHKEIPFIEPSGGGVPDREYVGRLRVAQNFRPGGFVQRDYDFTKPNTDLETSAKGKLDSSYTHFAYPGGYAEKAEGDRKAGIRQEEHDMQREIIH